MKHKLERPEFAALILVLICTIGSWAGFPKLGFLAGCAADVGVHVPGDRFFWSSLFLPPVAWVFAVCGLKSGREGLRRLLIAAALAIALLSAASMLNLYWQYHICEVPFVEMSCDPQSYYP